MAHRLQGRVVGARLAPHHSPPGGSAAPALSRCSSQWLFRCLLWDQVPEERRRPFRAKLSVAPRGARRPRHFATPAWAPTVTSSVPTGQESTRRMDRLGAEINSLNQFRLATRGCPRAGTTTPPRLGPPRVSPHLPTGPAETLPRSGQAILPRTPDHATPSMTGASRMPPVRESKGMTTRATDIARDLIPRVGERFTKDRGADPALLARAIGRGR